MTILRGPFPSRSFRSWNVIAGAQEQHVCVQERTPEGLAKNKRVLHRLLFSDVDTRPFRIIYSENPIDFGLAASRLRDSSDTSRLVLAVADEFAEIMADWDILLAAGTASRVGSNSAPSTEGKWSSICRAAAEQRYGSRNASVRRLSISRHSGIYSPTELVQRSGRNSETGDIYPITRALDPYDLFLIRIIDLCKWCRPVDTILYLVLISGLWFFGLMRWPLLCVVTFIAGLPLGRRMSAAEAEAGAKHLCKLETLVGWHCSRQIVSAAAGMVLVEYVTSIIMPEWRWVYIVEWAAVPILVAFILHAGVDTLVSGRLWLSAAQPSLVMESATDGSYVAITDFDGTNRRSTEKEKDETVLFDGLPHSLSEHNKAIHARIAPPGPFSTIVKETADFAKLENGWKKVKNLSSGVVIWEKISHYSNRKAVQCIVNIPNANVGTLQRILLDDTSFENKASGYAYQYDTFLAKRKLIEYIGLHELILLTQYKSLAWGVAPREVLSYVSPANLLTPTQQETLGLRSQEAAGHGMAFSQCCIDCPNQDMPLPISKGYIRANAHVYLILGLEESDGSLTLRGCFDISPAGSIPPAVQRSVNQVSIERLENVANLLRQLGPKPNICRTYVNDIYFQPLLDRVQPPLSSTARRVSLTSASPAPTTPVASSPSAAAAAPREEVMRIAARFVKELLLREWRPHTDKSGVALFTTTTPWSDKKAVKTVTFVPGITLREVDDTVNDPTLTPKYEITIAHKAIVKPLAPGVSLVHTKLLSPIWGVAARDMVTRVAGAFYPNPDAQRAMGLQRFRGDVNGETPSEVSTARAVFIHAGEDAAMELSPIPKHQRGHCFLFGTLAEEGEATKGGEKGVWITSCAAADPGGSLPTSLVDAVIIGQIDKTVKLVQLLKQRTEAKVSKQK